jgi:enamine deaminase RidA (YjgF/YER057c/UK114 family)
MESTAAPNAPPPAGHYARAIEHRGLIYVSDVALWGRVNEVYVRFFGDHRPARAVVPTRELHFGYQVEIEAVAAVAGTHDD